MKSKRENIWKITALGLLGVQLFLALAVLAFFDISFSPRFKNGGSAALAGAQTDDQQGGNAQSLKDELFPPGGVVLAAEWKDLGKQMMEAGVIDSDKFESLYASRGGLPEDQLALIAHDKNGKLTIDEKNSSYILNLFWALGLANNNAALDEGPMQDYGDPAGFASTGGWSLSAGSPMDHYSAHYFVPLTPEQEALVQKVAQNIYRPCCNNPTSFPDCNHGMAMLGFLQLLASQGVNEDEMYRQALAMNTYWFPTEYFNIAQFFKAQGISWSDVNPQEVLSAQYSSSSGYRQVLSAIQPQNVGGGGGCSV